MRYSTWTSIVSLGATFLVFSAAGCSSDSDTDPKGYGGAKTASGGDKATAGAPSAGGGGRLVGVAGAPEGGAPQGGGGTANAGAPDEVEDVAGAGGDAGAGGAASTTDVEIHNSAAGNIVTDERGFSLYVHLGDTASTTAPVSTCNAGCIENWPAFDVQKPAVPEGLAAADFGSFDRGAGVKQATYKGWPLYFFGADAAPGDIKGDGVKGVWFLVKVPFVKPAQDVQIHTITAGDVFTDVKGLSLYVHKGDTASATAPVSTCTAGCLTTWPVFYVDKPRLPPSLNAADFGSFDRGGGVKQATYKGWPLYSFANDVAAGDIKGDGLNNVWFVAKLPFTPPG